jgi:hypothetical protein
VDEISPALLDAIHSGERAVTGVAIVVVLWMIYRCVSEKHLTAPALIVIAWTLCFWQDPLSSYFRPFLFYSAGMFNYGSWGPFVPGYSLPNGYLAPQPLLFLGTGYIGMTPLWAFACAWLLGKIKKGIPTLGPIVLFLIATALIGSVDFALESSSVKQGMFAFPSVFAPLSINVGKTYQYPIYSSYFFGAAIAVSSMLLVYRDSQGLMSVEAGSETITSPFMRGLLRVLAVTGVTNVGMLLLYMVPMAVLSLGSGPVPRLPTHLFNSAICAPDASFVCEGINASKQGAIVPRRGESAPQ